MACIKVRWSYLNSHLQTKKKEKKIVWTACVILLWTVPIYLHWISSSVTYLSAFVGHEGFVSGDREPWASATQLSRSTGFLWSQQCWLPLMFGRPYPDYSVWIGILIYAPNLTNYHLICVELSSQVLTISRRFHIQNHTRSECFWVWYVTHRRKVNYVSSSPIY